MFSGVRLFKLSWDLIISALGVEPGLGCVPRSSALYVPRIGPVSGRYGGAQVPDKDIMRELIDSE